MRLNVYGASSTFDFYRNEADSSLSVSTGLMSENQPSKLGKTPLMITAIYAALGTLWILYLDQLQSLMGADAEVSGTPVWWTFLFITSILLYALMHRAMAGQSEPDEGPHENEHLSHFHIDAAGSVIFCLSTEHKIQEWNRAAEKASGYLKEEVIGEDFLQLFIPEQHRIDAARNIENVLKGENASDCEYPFRTREGEEGVFLWNCERLLDAYGEPVGVIASGHDISERIKAREELERERDSLQDTIRRLGETAEAHGEDQGGNAHTERLQALGNMARGLAHEINNSLSSVSMISSLGLRQEDLSEKIRACLENIRKASSDATGVVAQIREFYRPRSGSEEFSSVDINEIVTEAVAQSRPKWKDEPNSRGVSVDVVTELEATSPISGNGSQLRDVVENIILNSVDAMPEGGAVTIRTSEEDDCVQIAITDTGTGMEEETRQKVFEPFFTSKDRRGAGLGLSVCWGILQRHNGQIEVSSESGNGAVFIIRLPVATN